MTPATADSSRATRALILAPGGRDTGLIKQLLGEGGLAAEPFADLPAVLTALREDAGLIVVFEEALRHPALPELQAWVKAQPSWSDLPILLLALAHNRSLPRKPPTEWHLSLGNVTLIERPLHPEVLLSSARTAVRARQRQYQTRSNLLELASRSEELQASENQLRFALEAGQLGAWELDLVSSEMRCSAQCKQNYGRPADQPFSYRELHDCIEPDDLPAMQKAVAESIDGTQSYETEYRIRWPDGSQHWIEVRGRVVLRPDGSPVLSGTTADITQRRQAQTQLLQTNALLERLVHERSEELDRAQQEWRNTEEQLRQSQKMEAIGQLTGGIAHDFNNLLTGILGSMELLERRLGEGRHADLPRFVHTAKLSARKAATLTHRLLAFSRRQPLDPVPIDVNALILSFDDVFVRALGESLRYEKKLTAGLHWACVDPNQLENALLNLVINARDATAAGGVIRLVTENLTVKAASASAPDDLAAGDYVSVAVQDTGSGMTPEVLQKAFEPFFTTKPIGQGSGLGLAMVYGFLKQSGGQVRITSVVGEGTQIQLIFPRVAEPGAVAIAAEKGPRDFQKGSGRILVVEDDQGVRTLITELLRGVGYELLTAVSSTDALPLLRSGEVIDLLLTDIGLPGMNGRDLAELARLARPELKILFMTGYANAALTRDSFSGSGMDLITKPFELDALVLRIQQMLDG